MKTFKKNIRTYFLLFLFVITIFLWSVVVESDNRGEMSVAFLDVGQGDAVFIETPNGNQILIDGGATRGVLRELSKLMPFYDRSIDVVIATHPDADHIGGLPYVFERFSVGMFLESSVVVDNTLNDILYDRVFEENAKHIIAQRGMKLHLDDGVVLTILFPDREMKDANPNDASIIAKLTYFDSSFLFTGDSPSKIERYVTALDGSFLSSDVLKVGHHGSNTSSDVRFVGFVSPEIAIISVGEDNRYGHPHREVLEIFKNFGAKILRTDQLGTIIVGVTPYDMYIK